MAGNLKVLLAATVPSRVKAEIVNNPQVRFSPSNQRKKEFAGACDSRLCGNCVAQIGPSEPVSQQVSDSFFNQNRPFGVFFSN